MCRVLFLLAALATAATTADAQAQPATTTETTASKSKPQGIAVVASGSAREEAFTLARAVYASSLRPHNLDELRARILAGDPAPPTATKELRELAELRAGVTGEDAASRRLLAAISQQLGVQGLLVVSRGPGPEKTEKAGTPETGPSGADAGATGAASAAAPTTGDAGAPATPAPTGNPVSARLFLAETGELDAARYEPDASGWRGTVTSLSGRFPPPPAPVMAQLQVAAPKLPSEGKESRPFYLSPWLWGAIGAAALVGGFFFFASQDTGDDPIHLQMRVPR
jgi:hypothetical protein